MNHINTVIYTIGDTLGIWRNKIQPDFQKCKKKKNIGGHKFLKILIDPK